MSTRLDFLRNTQLSIDDAMNSNLLKFPEEKQPPKSCLLHCKLFCLFWRKLSPRKWNWQLRLRSLNEIANYSGTHHVTDQPATMATMNCEVRESRDTCSYIHLYCCIPRPLHSFNPSLPQPALVNLIIGLSTRKPHCEVSCKKPNRLSCI